MRWLLRLKFNLRRQLLGASFLRRRPVETTNAATSRGGGGVAEVEFSTEELEQKQSIPTGHLCYKGNPRPIYIIVLLRQMKTTGKVLRGIFDQHDSS